MTIQLDTIRALAAFLAVLRPTWDPTATANQLLAHKDIPLPILAAAATRCALDETNRTPAALKWMSFTTGKSGERVEDPSKAEPRCDVCGRSRQYCDVARAAELRYGVPDVHSYEPARRSA
jgi:hypothetical protein